MRIEALEAAALKLEPKSRARLARSLDQLSPEQNARIWSEEAQRRLAALDGGTLGSQPAYDVFREARMRTKPSGGSSPGL